MKLKEIKVGMLVRDTWWPHTILKVTRVLKTRIHLDYIRNYSNHDLRTYDLQHIKFLERYRR